MFQLPNHGERCQYKPHGCHCDLYVHAPSYFLAPLPLLWYWPLPCWCGFLRCITDQLTKERSLRETGTKTSTSRRFTPNLSREEHPSFMFFLSNFRKPRRDVAKGLPGNSHGYRRDSNVYERDGEGWIETMLRIEIKNRVVAVTVHCVISLLLLLRR